MRSPPAALLALLLVSVEVHAAPAEKAGSSSAAKSPEDRALELFEASEVAYREGRFQDAIDLLVEAYALTPEPVLLYNLGRAYEGLGAQEKAVDAYEHYLKADPDAKDRKSIESRIANLKKQIAEREALAKQAEEERRRAEEAERARKEKGERSPSRSPSIVPWIVAGAGVVVLSAGVVLGVSARARHDDAVADPVQASAADAQDDAERRARFSTIGIGAGAAIAALGIGWGIYDLARDARRDVAAAAPVRVSIGPLGVALGGSF